MVEILFFSFLRVHLLIRPSFPVTVHSLTLSARLVHSIPYVNGMEVIVWRFLLLLSARTLMIAHAQTRLLVKRSPDVFGLEMVRKMIEVVIFCETHDCF